MDGVRRGDLVSVAVSSDYGKPRPALIVQDNAFALLHSVTVLLISSDLQDSPLVRIPLLPSPDNGLRRPSQVMIDKTMTVPRTRLGPTLGRIDRETMASVDRALLHFLGLGGLVR